MSRFQSVLSSIAGACAAACIVGSAAADPVADFYKGKTLTMVVDSATGGINDVTGRLVARYLTQTLPGAPKFVVQNIMGARGIAAVNHLYNVAPKDGTVIAIVLRGVAQAHALDSQNVQYDPEKFVWLGSTSSYGNDAYGLMVMADRPVKSWQDLKQPGKSIRVGALRAASTNLTFPLFAKEVLKLNVEVIRGYGSAGEVFLAMQRGELDGQAIGLSAAKIRQSSMWDAGQLRVLIQFARETRHPDLPDVPTGRELVTNADDLALLAYAEAPFRMALPFLAPPDVPADRAAALQTAFMRVHGDPQFRAEAAKLDIDVSPIDGKAVAELVAATSRVSPAVIARFKALSGMR